MELLEVSRRVRFGTAVLLLLGLGGNAVQEETHELNYVIYTSLIVHTSVQVKFFFFSSIFTKCGRIYSAVLCALLICFEEHEKLPGLGITAFARGIIFMVPLGHQTPSTVLQLKEDACDPHMENLFE